MGISDAVSVDLILEIAQELNSSLDLPEVLGNVLRLTVEATSAVRGSLFLLDEQGHVVRRILARPNQSPKISERNIQRVMADGLAAWIYQYKQGALVSDTITDERWVFLPGDNVTNSVLGVPLLYRGHVNGILTLHHRKRDFFTEAHLTLAMGIAGQAAVAIENARLFTKIRQDHEALYALLKGLPLPVLVVVDDLIIFRNSMAKQVLGINQANMPLLEISGGDRLAPVLTDLPEAEAGRSVEVDWPDQRVFQVSVNNVPEYGLVIALDDVTEFKTVAAMKSQLVETVSHDLKNPLSHIKGFAKLLATEPLSDQGRINLEQIIQSATQMESLVTHLLDLAIIEAGTDESLQPCDLAQLTVDLLPEFELQLQAADIHLETELPLGLGQVMADPLRLCEIVSNYVSNAIKYTPRQGNVSVTISRHDDEMWLLVSDTGRGIPPGAHAQLFDKFYRVPITNANEWVEGTGLGLAIVKAIAEDYGGRVWVESTVGGGSTFGCALPVIAKESETTTGES